MFAGALLFQNSPCHTNQDTINHALSPYLAPQKTGQWQSATCWLHEQSHHVTDLPLPLVNQTGQCGIAFWGRLDNRSTLLDILNQPTNCSDSELILAGWEKWAEHLPEHLLGDFALAILDNRTHVLFLARDPLGVKSLYYRFDELGMIFGTSVPVINAVHPHPPTPDTEWIVRYLWNLSFHTETTAYSEVRKLPPGHCLKLHLGGKPHIRRWHHWQDNPPRAIQRESHWVDKYRSILEESIHCRIRGSQKLGSENSGGIDSATITAYLAKFLPVPSDQLYSYGFTISALEAEYILETSHHCGIRHNYLISTLSHQKTTELERTIKVLGYPDEHANAVLHTPFYRDCSLHGINRLFSGFGGDEVVTNPGHLLPYELLDEGLYSALWGITPGNSLSRPLRFAKRLVQQKNPAYHASLRQTFQQRWPSCILQKDVAEHFNIQNLYLERAQFDAPFRRINDFILNHHLSKMHLTARLENCTLIAASYGIDYCWPLWDVRLVQQYLSTPSIEKVGPKGITRYLHRRAIDNTVPKKVTWKATKNMGNFITDSVMAWNPDNKDELLDLHPHLTEIIDLPKWHKQVASLANISGTSDYSQLIPLKNNVNAIRRLNLWLHTM